MSGANGSVGNQGIVDMADCATHCSLAPASMHLLQGRNSLQPRRRVLHRWQALGTCDLLACDDL